MTQVAAPAAAQANASNCTPALPLNALRGILVPVRTCVVTVASLHGEPAYIPFLIVSAVRAPTAKAPVNSKHRQSTMACRYVTEREETDVAQALATSSTAWSAAKWLLGTRLRTYLHHCCTLQEAQTLCQWQKRKYTLPSPSWRFMLTLSAQLCLR